MRRMILAAGLVAAVAGTAMAEKQKNPAPVAPQASPAPPRDEAPEIQRLRRLMGAGATLTYAQATRDGAAMRLSGVALTYAGTALRAAEMRLEGVREDGLDLLSARNVTGNGLTVATFEMRGLSGTGGTPRLGGASATGIGLPAAGALLIERATLGRVEPGQAATLETTNWRMQPGGAVESVTLRRFALSSPDAGAVMAFLTGTVPNTAAALNAEAEGLEVRSGGQRVGGIERATLTNTTSAAGVSTARLAFAGVELLAQGALATMLQPLGYPSLRAELQLDALQDPARGRSEITALALGVRDAGAIGFAAAMDGVRPGDMARAAEQARLVSARLRYADQSLYRRVVEAQARERRTTPDALRREWVQQAEALLSGPQLAAIRTPVQRFLRGEAREIELVAAPPRPVGRDALANPPADFAGWQRLLGLTVTAR